MGITDGGRLKGALIEKAYFRRLHDSLSTLAAVFFSGGGSSFTIASMTRGSIGSISVGKNAGEWAPPAAGDFLKFQRGGFRGGPAAAPLLDGCGVRPLSPALPAEGKA